MAKMMLTLYSACKDAEGVYTKVLEKFENNIKERKKETSQIHLEFYDGTHMYLEIQDEKEKVKQQVDGMYNFFTNIPCEDKHLLQTICTQISLFTCICGIRFESTKEERIHILTSIFEVAKQCNALILYPDMSLYTFDGNLLLSVDGKSEVENFSILGDEEIIKQCKMPSRYDIEVFEEIQKEFQMKGWQLPNCIVKEQLLFEEVHLPEKEDIVKRFLALYALASFAKAYLQGYPVSQIKEKLELLETRFNLSACLKEQEASVLKKVSMEKQQAVELLSKYECLHTLLWSLGKGSMESLDSCETEKIETWLLQFTSFEELCKNTEKRDEKEIYQQYVRMFYTERFYMQSVMFSAFTSLQEDVICERLRACKWLCNGC